MSPPSKLAVEIAEAVGKGMCIKLSPSHVYELAALIDAKIRPLVEDGARLDRILSYNLVSIATSEVNESSGRGGEVLIKTEDTERAFWNGYWGAAHNIEHDLREAIDAARAQRPAQEGSDKP